MDYKEGKILIEKKVDDFRSHKNIYLSKKFDETENRTHFINPLFQALGWDFEQTNMPYHLWDVHQEFSQKDRKRKTKKPDYAFRVDKKVKFFVEAKAPWVPLTEKDPVFQAKSYAFSTNGKAPIIILTDFEELRVFKSIEKPIYKNPLQGLIKEYDLTFENYIEKWDLLYNTFSKEAVCSNSLEILKGKITKNTKTLDKEFLETLMGWRTDLAMRIAKDNKELTEPQLNECVQRIIDRLIFIRNLEDRDIEENINLINLLDEKETLYPRLIPIFNQLDASYNGLLFHKHLSEKINVDDKTIRNIIKNLYPNLSPFQFDAIEPEILGRIYEKFLGSKIYLTKNHQGKVKEKPEVIHAKGVYYTPQWVVDIITENTLGNLIKGKNPEQITKIKILDPACGSGSFLLGAFDYLLKYHKEWYSKNESVKKYQNDYIKNQNGEIILTNPKKSEILKNSIFGVDIDREATEVAIMSLYLKALEEGIASPQLEMFKKGSILPEMSSNIRCGNSLITRDQLYEHDMFGDETITPLDWNDESKGFGKIFKENDGFDCVIGNPPYIKTQELQKFAMKEVELYKKLYNSASFGNVDIYVVFIEKGLSLLNKNGLLGYICPHKFFNSDYGLNLRKIINTGKKIKSIINFGVNQVFENATTYTCLLFLSSISNQNFKYYKFKNDVNDLESYILQNKIPFFNIDSNAYSGENWQFINEEDAIFIKKMNANNPLLEDITNNIFQGPKAGADPVFILRLKEDKGKQLSLFSKSIEKNVLLETGIMKPYIKGKFIKNYNINFDNEYIIYPYDENGKLYSSKYFSQNYPLAWDYLNEKENKKILNNRENGRFKKTFWCYSRPQNMQIIRKNKILTPFNAFHASYCYDEKADFIFSAGVSGAYGIILKESISINYFYLLGLLNSNVMDKYLKIISTALRGGFYSYENKYIKRLPIYIPDEEIPIKFEKCVQIEKMAKQILEFNSDINKKDDAEYLEKKIDELVEEIYLS